MSESGSQLVSVGYTVAEDGVRLFMESIVQWTYPDGTFHRLDESARIAEVSFKEDGTLFRDIRTFDLETRFLTFEECVSGDVVTTAPLYRDIPTFGNWDSVREPVPAYIMSILE